MFKLNFIKLFIKPTILNMSRQTSSVNTVNYVKFLELVGNLKQLKRTGWVLRSVSEPETIAAHMYRMAMMSFLIPNDSELNRIKIMEMALVHDLAESIVGDLTPYCGVSKEEKRRREENAIVEISNLIGSNGENMLRLFEEYEKQESAEAKFVKDCDRYDMVLQAFEYEKRDETPNKHQEFFDSTFGQFRHPLIISLVDELNKQRQEYQENFPASLEKKENTSSS